LKRYRISTLLTLLFSFFLFGCADKDPDEYRPAVHWYQKIAKEVARGNMERAGDAFLSLQGQHIKSPLLAPAMLMMSEGHMAREEELLANYYLDEYLKRFGTPKNRAFIDFLKLKANYFGLKQPKRDQKLLLDTEVASENYFIRYPASPYNPMAGTIVSHIVATEKHINTLIADLYTRIDKPKGAEFYTLKQRDTFLQNAPITPPSVLWLREIFE